MIIKIDTKRDSKEDIMKLIHFLNSLADSGSFSSGSYSAPSNMEQTLESNPGIFSMFGETRTSGAESSNFDSKQSSEEKKTSKNSVRIELY